MNENSLKLFSLSGKVAVITGGTGVLGSTIAHGIAAAGAKVAILGRREETAQEVADEIKAAGGEAMPLPGDVLERDSLESARKTLLDKWGKIDMLLNVAGGNMAGATIGDDDSFFDMPQDAFEQVVALNLTGTVLPSQIFGEAMAKNSAGVIINISSMAAQLPLTRVVGYSAAKSAVDNFTRWLAVELAHKHGDKMRVNAVAPGFFVGEQNRKMLLNDDDSLTARGQKIIDNTPMRRFGEAEELVGTIIWLLSDASRFVTGIVVPVDGGFSAFSGV